MREGYCSHDADRQCPNCGSVSRTYYVVNSTSLSDNTLERHKPRILYWLGRKPETEEDKQEIEQLNLMLRQNYFFC